MPETLFSPVGTICVVAHPDMNISSQPKGIHSVDLWVLRRLTELMPYMGYNEHSSRRELDRIGGIKY